MSKRTHCLEVWGDFACFSRPEMKVERYSYPIITLLLRVASSTRSISKRNTTFTGSWNGSNFSIHPNTSPCAGMK